VDLTQVPGVTVAGLPGFGRTSLINRLLSDWAPSPAVQFACADGKLSAAHEGDYANWVQRMFAFAGDDLEEANKLFRHLTLAAENARLVEDLVKKGRSVGMLVILATQKSTGDAIPTFIRDVCPVGLSFAQKTAPKPPLPHSARKSGSGRTPTRSTSKTPPMSASRP
jgi:S-DNA-T family DNA segregation ATPase FtsK/SpoIIIE